MQYLESDKAVEDFLNEVKDGKDKVIQSVIEDYAGWSNLKLPREADVLPELYAMVLCREKIYRATEYLNFSQKAYVHEIDSKVQAHFSGVTIKDLAPQIQKAAHLSNIPPKSKWWWWLGVLKQNAK